MLKRLFKPAWEGGGGGLFTINRPTYIQSPVVEAEVDICNRALVGMCREGSGAVPSRRVWVDGGGTRRRSRPCWGTIASGPGTPAAGHLQPSPSANPAWCFCAILRHCEMCSVLAS